MQKPLREQTREETLKEFEYLTQDKLQDVFDCKDTCVRLKATCAREIKMEPDTDTVARTRPMI